MVPDFWEFDQVPKWDVRASEAAETQKQLEEVFLCFCCVGLENMPDLEHMPLPFLDFSHKHIIF